MFRDLKVRPKLMVLHNVFFLVLALAVYFALIPLFEQRVAQARARELSLIEAQLAEARPLLRLPGMEIYDYQEGTGDALRIPAAVRAQLDAKPGTIERETESAESVYLKDPHSGLYRRLRLPHQFYEDVLWRAKWSLFAALGLVYLLAVILAEALIMPKYVFRPLRALLAADDAARSGEREKEIVPAQAIAGDEIGQIMRSRNSMLEQLRRHETDLERVNHDLTDKNALLETAKKNIADQDRLVSLGMLSAGMAHEINTPLAVLHGSIEKLIETVTSPAAQERLARMRRVTERLRRMSESLVDFARVRRQNNEPVEVRGLIDESWQLVAIDEKARSARFRNGVCEGHAVMGNADRLIQLFVNLLRNAVHAIESGGSIEVESHAGDDWVAIAVNDDGKGIPEDVLPNIFEAFVTTRLDARGTGLGLTVAEGIAHQHGGSITASNRPGGGARLAVKLPRAQMMAEGAGSGGLTVAEGRSR
jgi:signal transduction histidine kinase